MDKYQEFLAGCFMETGREDSVEIEGVPVSFIYYDFNTALHPAGDGDFRIAILEHPDGSLEVADYESGDLSEKGG